MCYSIYRLTSVMKLCQAAHKVQQLIDDGTLAEAFGRNKNGEAHESIAAFNLLAESAATVTEEHKAVSPFLRYRNEIMADTTIGGHLRKLVMCLSGGFLVDLAALFSIADPHHHRIALELIAAGAVRPVDQTFIATVQAVIYKTQIEQVAA